MAISNKLGAMVLSTGNKSEMSVGYATLYGDMCGGYSVLKDAYKTSVFALSRWRNRRRPDGMLGPDGPVMPERIITKPPTAELRPDQTDEAALGSYGELDAVLRHLVDGMNEPARAAALAAAELGSPVPIAYAERIARLVWHAEYKRRQGPMGVVLSGRGYDKGWRLPVTNAYGL
jgi:NAD+ synthase